MDNIEDIKKDIKNSDLIELARKYKTPLYVYYKDLIEENVKKYYSAFKRYKKFKLLYAYKANTNIAICEMLHKLGLGADVVSGGELYIARLLGLNPEEVIFTSNAKSDEELIDAINFNCVINIDSFDEIYCIEELLKKNNNTNTKKPNISFRINPSVNPHTHDKIATGVKESKFGIPIEEAFDAYKIAKEKNFNIVGIHTHIGSQINETEPFIEASEKIMDVVYDLKKLEIKLKFIDLGGGLGIDYFHTEDEKEDEKEDIQNPKKEVNQYDPKYLAEAILPVIEEKSLKLKYTPELWLEPGRSIVGNAGVLLTKVVSIKKTPYKKFINVDAGFNDLIRPAMYDAYHHVINLNRKIKTNTNEKFHIAGNLCESGDIIAKDRVIEAEKGDILAVLDTGAYGFSMSSNYNSRPKPAEVIITKKDNVLKEILIRKRESYESMLIGQQMNLDSK